MDNVFLVNSASFDTLTITTSLLTVPGAMVDFSHATYVSGTFQGIGSSLTGITASYVDSSVTVSVSNSSSYLSPGATFYLVSGSDGVPPAYIEPYDYCTTGTLYRPPFKEGRLVWDHKYIDYAHYMDTSWRIHLGKEVTIGVHNPTAATMSRLSPVYMSGSSTGEFRPDVYLAIADGTGTKSNVIGIIRHDIPPNSNGWVLMQGEMHRTNVSPYGTVGTRLWLDPVTPGALTSTKPGQPNEIVGIGYVSEAGIEGSFICDVYTEPPPANAYAGMTSIPSIVDNTASFQVYVGSGSVNLYNNVVGIGAITQYSVSPITFSVPASLTSSFIYVASDGVTASYALTNDYSSINGISNVLLATIYRADQDTHWLESKQEGAALANKLNNRLIATERFVRESGFTLYVTGSNYYVITAGSIWFGATKVSQQEFDSRNTGSVDPAFETHWAYHSASSWTIPTQSDGKYNNLYYDDGTNLVPLAPDSWSVNYFYRILGENPFDEDVFIIPSNYQYLDEASADADVVPAEVPAVLTDVSLFVGRVIFQSGSTTGTAQSAFAYTFGSSTVSQHNGLAGIQGGQGGEYYHLTNDQYLGLGISASYAKSSSYSLTCSYAAGGDVSINPVGDDFNYQVVLSPVTSSAATTLKASERNTFYFNVLNDSLTSRRITGSLYGTSSQASSASYWDSSSIAAILNDKQWNISTGSTLPITSSWAEYVVNLSYISGTMSTGSTYPITASFAVSSSYALSSSYAQRVKEASLTSGSTYNITASYAVTSSYALLSSASNITYMSASMTSSQVLGTSNVWFPGPQMLVPAGTWLVNAFGTFQRSATGATSYGFKLESPTKVYAQSLGFCPTSNPHYCNIAVSAICVFDVETELTASGLTNNGSPVCFLACSSSIQPSGSVATQIIAIKLS